MRTTEYKPLDLFQPSLHPHDSQPALVILNTPLPALSFLKKLWASTSYHLCADGGANRLHDLFTGDSEDQRSNYLPTEIHGDLDSLRTDVRDYYNSRGVIISRDPDQESTDFGKAIRHIRQQRPGPSDTTQDILILGSLSGRVDHGLGLLSQLYKEQYRDSTTRLWLFSECSISFILEAGRNIIYCPLSSGLVTQNVGIIPVFGRAVVSTKGLEWDVEEWETEMGKRVSTSNHVRADEVEVCTNERVLFTVERAQDSAA